MSILFWAGLSFAGLVAYAFMGGIFYRIAYNRCPANWPHSSPHYHAKQDVAIPAAVFWPFYILYLVAACSGALGARLAEGGKGLQALSPEAFRERRHEAARREFQRQMERVRWQNELSAAIDKDIALPPEVLP